jgi:hypothetical protein
LRVVTHMCIDESYIVVYLQNHTFDLLFTKDHMVCFCGYRMEICLRHGGGNK